MSKKTFRVDPVEAMKLEHSEEAAAIDREERAESTDAMLATMYDEPGVILDVESIPVARVYRVVAPRRIAYDGFITRVAAGKIIEEKAYGAAGIANLRAQGLVLELIEG